MVSSKNKNKGSGVLNIFVWFRFNLFMIVDFLFKCRVFLFIILCLMRLLRFLLY